MGNDDFERLDAGRAVNEDAAQSDSHVTMESSTESLSGNDEDAHDPATGSLELVQEDSEVCNRCREIPWEKMLQEYSELRYDIAPAEGSDMPLKQSSCRVCRWLAITFRVGDDEIDYGFRLKKWGSAYNPDHLDIEFRTRLSWTGNFRSHKFVFCGNEDTNKCLVLADYIPVDDSSEARYQRAMYADMGEIKSWVKKCKTDHCSDCAVESISEMTLRRLRVIDCERNIVVSAPNKCLYVALSYVWGQHSRATESLRSPPKTVADSIYLTKRLGYRYLWIDRYCINQADVTDKHTQILQMGNIYASAQVTIVAAAGNDPSHGLPGVCKTARACFATEKVGDVLLSVVPSLGELAQSRWASRAWTFQEFYFSKRRLIFTETRSIYMCNNSVQYEQPSWFDMSPPMYDYWIQGHVPQCALSGPTQTSQDPMTRATSYLTAYSNRLLSYDSDAVDAIAGALHPLRKEFVYHAWGLPCLCSAKRPTQVSAATLGQSQEERIALLLPGREELGKAYIALTWWHLNPARRRVEFPSWSPLGWEGEMSWFGYEKVEFPTETLVDATAAKIRVSSDVYEISRHVLEQDNAIFSKSNAHAILEINLRTADLDIHRPESADPSNLRVVLELTVDCSIILRLNADVDLMQLGIAQLTGALIHSTDENPPRAFVMVLAARGELFERVGFLELTEDLQALGPYVPNLPSRWPRGKLDLRKDRRRHLPGYDEEEAAREIRKIYSTDFGAWWQHIFKDNGPVKIM